VIFYEKVYNFYFLLIVNLNNNILRTANTVRAEYWVKLYNACDGTCGCSGWTLDFYIDNVFIATIKPGKNYSTAVTAGWRIFSVRHNQEVITASVMNAEITGEGWVYWFGCEDGTYPKDIGYKSTGDDVISSYSGYVR